MASIDPKEYQKRLDKLTSMLGDIVRHADIQAQSRCPYKNRHDECTAQFGCRNQRKTEEREGALLCVGDDKLDYRSAWESEQRPLEASGTEGAARVICGDQSHPSAKHEKFGAHIRGLAESSLLTHKHSKFDALFGLVKLGTLLTIGNKTDTRTHRIEIPCYKNILKNSSCKIG